MVDSESSPFAWHAIAPETALQQLGTPADGLTEADAQARLQRYGPNLLPERGPAPLWHIIGRQFASPLIYILLIAAVISALIGDFEDSFFIAVVLAINAAIGAYQEWQAEKSSHALRKLLRIHAMVQRDGQVRELMADQVTPGDIVWLESGNRVPADLRLISSHGLEVDESLLTGESVAVAKNSRWNGDESTLLADRINMAFAGSIVSRGRAHGVVVATGLHTAIGQLALDVLGDDGGKPPLLLRMERFTQYVAIGTMVASVLIGGLGVWLWKHTLVDAFFLVIALAVSAIPEGLPVAMTVALAVATTRMSKRNVIVRRLTAVEGLGSCTLIATDKTGTLTCNELTVKEIWLPSRDDHPPNSEITISGEGFAPFGQAFIGGKAIHLQNEDDHQAVRGLLETAILCNEAELFRQADSWRWRGDAVDIALLSLGVKLGADRPTLLKRLPPVSQIPFESERQWSASFQGEGSMTRVCVKGAPERIADMCLWPSNADREKFEDAYLDLASRGHRILALAHGKLNRRMTMDEVPSTPGQLQFLGLIGMIDPLRSSAKDAVEACRRAGVQVTMITGDHRVTATAIARQLGLVDDPSQVVTAEELEGANPSELQAIVARTRVFARVTPRQKLQIVEAAIAMGHYVAVTGDGANDAPALRAANIGVAMGKSGTDVAREAAELVISDDHFASIVGGIEEGRIAYDNIRKVIYLLVSMGAAELLMVLLAVVKGLPVPLLPVQLLWLNLVTDGIQGVAMAFEPGEGNVLERPPRKPNEPIFNRLMIERMVVAVLVIGLGGFIVFDYLISLGWEVDQARNFLLLVMVLFELFHVGNCRSETRSTFAQSPLRSPILFFGTLGAFLVHLAGMYLPFLQSVLTTSPVSLSLWLVAVALAIVIVPAMELHKLIWAKRHRSNTIRGS